MSIDVLKLSTFRCFEEVDFQFSPKINVLSGFNGMGKTSVLEAIHFLSTGKSFRNPNAKHLIKKGSLDFSVFASIKQDQNNFQLGSQFNKASKKVLKLNQAITSKQTDLASTLPVLSIDPSSYLFCDNSPQFRRTFFDWMVFHVKHDYIITWSKVLRCQKQIYKLLKSKDTNQLPLWLNQYKVLGEQLNTERLAVFNKFKIAFADLCRLLTPDLSSCELSFYSGWSAENTLSEVLSNDWDNNLKYGQLNHGVHKMDLLLKSSGINIKSLYSRGQKKMIALICYLSCLKVMDQDSSNTTVLCLDDFDAELDTNNADHFFSYLQTLPNQILISTVEPKRYKGKAVKLFHVKH